MGIRAAAYCRELMARDDRLDWSRLTMPWRTIVPFFVKGTILQLGLGLGLGNDPFPGQGASKHARSLTLTLDP